MCVLCEYVGLELIITLQIPSNDTIPSREPNTNYHPLLAPVAIAGDLTAFLAWNTKSVGSLATLFSFVEGLIGLWGTWTVGYFDIRRGGSY